MTILTVAAHPDDEVLGCGGTMAHLSADHEVHVAILGEGATSRTQDRADADQAEVRRLQTHARSAAKLTGVASVTFEGLPDNRFDQLALLDVVKRVERIIDELKPEAVFTHHPGDLNIDHQVTARAVLTATRPMAGSPVRDVYSFEIPSSSEWSFGQTGRPFLPNVFFNITQTLDTKIAAMQCYEAEMRPYPHPRSAEALRAIAGKWGSTAGFHAAEAFELVRSVRP